MNLIAIKGCLRVINNISLLVVALFHSVGFYYNIKKKKKKKKKKKPLKLVTKSNIFKVEIKYKLPAWLELVLLNNKLAESCIWYEM